MSVIRLVLIGVAAYVCALAVTLPASLLAPRVAQLSGGQVRVSGAEGTLWRGAARLEVARPALNLQRVEWRFQPLALLQGEARVALTSQDSALSGEAVVGRGFTAWTLRDTTVTASAASVSQLLPALGALSPEGQITLKTDRLACQGERCTGPLEITWRNAAVGLAEQRPLGDYALSANLQGERADFELKTLAGALRLAGRGQATLGAGGVGGIGNPSFNGEASAAPDVLPKVQGLLKLVGTPDARGTVKISLGGQ